MSKNKGARARTRKLFSKNRIQKKENNSHIRKTLYKINDKIIVKPNSSFQKVFIKFKGFTEQMVFWKNWIYSWNNRNKSSNRITEKN